VSLRFSLVIIILFPFLLNAQENEKYIFKAGAAIVDISPTTFPVIVNGNFLEVLAKSKIDDLYAKALVLDDGKNQIALVVVDSCMMPSDFLNEVKKMAHETTGIPANRIMISATHTHTAPSVMGILGARADEGYKSFLGPQIVRVISLAKKNMVPAKVGYKAFHDEEHTFCRRWIYRPDKMLTDPFGDKSVRANMHPGHKNPSVIGPSGPVDTAITLLSLQTDKGLPLAVFANYSMHYYGSVPVCADYYGHFCDALNKKINSKSPISKNISFMSQGTSGDLMWMNYGEPSLKRDISAYASAVADRCYKALETISYENWVPLDMVETTMSFGKRTPNAKREEWARKLISEMKSPLPKNRDEVYAKEQIYLLENPKAQIKLQAIRIGNLGITAIPNEVFGLTGIKIKEQSPFDITMNIELANGAEGYIPPPEQHALGGYTAWPARSAALEVQAEPKIVESLLKSLEQLAKAKRKARNISDCDYSKIIGRSSPIAYWRFEDFEGDTCVDSSGNKNHGHYEEGKAFYLPGPNFDSFGKSQINRAVHFAGGKMSALVPGISDNYTAEAWIWNGLAANVRANTGVIFSRGNMNDPKSSGELLSIGGTSANLGKLIFSPNNSSKISFAGKTIVPLKEWHHIALVRNKMQVIVYLNGNKEIETETVKTQNYSDFYVAGSSDNLSNFEGKVDEVAIYSRVLDAKDIRSRASINLKP